MTATQTKTVQLQYRHNDAYDTVVLVEVADDPDMARVLSDWTVDHPTVLSDFCDCLSNPADWDDCRGDEHTAGEYGVLVAIREDHVLTAIRHDLWLDRVAFNSR